jgi:translation initiation factor IF-1
MGTCPPKILEEQIMSKEEGIVLEGEVLEAVGNDKFRIKCIIKGDNGDTEHQAICHLAGKLRQKFIRIVSGDRVKVELTPYDLTKGRITYRLK